MFTRGPVLTKVLALIKEKIDQAEKNFEQEKAKNFEVYQNSIKSAQQILQTSNEIALDTVVKEIIK